HHALVDTDRHRRRTARRTGETHSPGANAHLRAKARLRSIGSIRARLGNESPERIWGVRRTQANHHNGSESPSSTAQIPRAHGRSGSSHWINRAWRPAPRNFA